MLHNLVFWTVVGMSYQSGARYIEHDWRPVGEFKSARACEHASKALGIGVRAKCIPTAEVTK